MCTIEDRYARERYHYERLNPILNIQHPGLSRIEAVNNWNERNKNRVHLNKINWAARNPEKVKEIQARYRAKKKSTQSL